MAGATRFGKVVKEDIAKQIEAFRLSYPDQISIDEVGGLVVALLSSLRGDVSAGDLYVHNELQSLSDMIDQVRRDIASLSPREINESHIPSATDELDAVIASTEEAANSILEAAEELETLAGELGGDASNRISDIVTKIYEASSFQDLTGQRINKVVGLLRHIEERITVLARASGHAVTPMAATTVDEDEDPEKALLNGPQLPSVAASQDDIDALFASFD